MIVDRLKAITIKKRLVILVGICITMMLAGGVIGLTSLSMLAQNGVRIKDKADSLGVTGWVKNMADGSVQALLQADRKDVMDKMLEWCQKGPSAAKVDKVVTLTVKDTHDFKDFKIKY